jgi:hypothetical protein
MAQVNKHRTKWNRRRNQQKYYRKADRFMDERLDAGITGPRQLDWPGRVPTALQSILSPNCGKNYAKSRILFFSESVQEFTRYYEYSARLKGTNSLESADAHSPSLLKFRIFLSDSSIPYLLKPDLSSLNT